MYRLKLISFLFCVLHLSLPSTKNKINQQNYMISQSFFYLVDQLLNLLLPRYETSKF